jgi:ketosteroid isomerase-like protein
MTTEDEIIALEARRCEAIATADFDALADTLADDYLHVFGSGVTGDKPGYIEGIRAGPRAPVRSNLTVRLYGDMAILNGDLLNTINAPGRPQRVIDAFVTQVARKENGRWRFVSFHITPKRPV